MLRVLESDEPVCTLESIDIFVTCLIEPDRRPNPRLTLRSGSGLPDTEKVIQIDPG